MKKPGVESYERFAEHVRLREREARQGAVPRSLLHLGAPRLDAELDMIDLALYLKKQRAAGRARCRTSSRRRCRWPPACTTRGIDPLTREPVYTAKTLREEAPAEGAAPVLGPRAPRPGARGPDGGGPRGSDRQQAAPAGASGAQVRARLSIHQRRRQQQGTQARRARRAARRGHAAAKNPERSTARGSCSGGGPGFALGGEGRVRLSRRPAKASSSGAGRTRSGMLARVASRFWMRAPVAPLLLVEEAGVLLGEVRQALRASKPRLASERASSWSKCRFDSVRTTASASAAEP